MLTRTLGIDDTLYVMGDGDKCKKLNHLLFPTTIYVKLQNSATIELQGQYCLTCNQFQITRQLCAENSHYHKLFLPKLFIKGVDDAEVNTISNDYIPLERNNESKLVKYGYSVSQNNKLSNAERQNLLRDIIVSKKVSKGYIVSYLEHMIAINGKKESNYIALQKWKNDLEYVLKL